jgi:hypothetical protein
MEEKELGSVDLKRFCQAVSPNDEPCDNPATVRCTRCGRWFLRCPRRGAEYATRNTTASTYANARLREARPD